MIDGKKIASDIIEEIRQKTSQYILQNKRKPGLAVVLVGENPASKIYVNNKVKKTKYVGMNSFEFNLPASISQAELLAKIEELNNNDAIDGILVQLPLPNSICEQAVINKISPAKDVDGFHIENSGKLATAKKLNQAGFLPCTAYGCLKLIKSVKKDITGLNALVVGRSNIVGKPVASMLLLENCTVTIAHSASRNLSELCRNSDIIIAAVGVPHLIKADWVQENAIVIDVGINRIANGKITGDVDYENIAKKTSNITPVPGGVGPMTIACLLDNTLTSYEKYEKQI